VAVANPLDDVYHKLESQKMLIELMYANFADMDKKIKVLNQTVSVLSDRLTTLNEFMRRESELHHYQMSKLREDVYAQTDDVALKLYQQMMPDKEQERERKKFLGLI
jgi:archaellum component FlaC